MTNVISSSKIRKAYDKETCEISVKYNGRCPGSLICDFFNLKFTKTSYSLTFIFAAPVAWHCLSNLGMAEYPEKPQCSLSDNGFF